MFVKYVARKVFTAGNKAVRRKSTSFATKILSCTVIPLNFAYTIYLISLCLVFFITSFTIFIFIYL